MKSAASHSPQPRGAASKLHPHLFHRCRNPTALFGLPRPRGDRHMGSGLFLGFSRQPRQVQHGLDQWDQTVHRGPTGGTVIDIRPSVRNKVLLLASCCSHVRRNFRHWTEPPLTHDFLCLNYCPSGGHRTKQNRTERHAGKWQALVTKELRAFRKMNLGGCIVCGAFLHLWLNAFSLYPMMFPCF